MNEFLEFIWETLKMAALALLIVLPIRYFLFQPFVVSGSSMAPNFHDGDYLIIDEISYYLRSPKRGEVAVFRAPPNPSARYIKRIIGLPGETIEVEAGRIVITPQRGESFVLQESEYILNGEVLRYSGRVELREDEYFVLGDNRRYSSDSRTWGPLPRKNIIGRALIRAWPVSRFSIIEIPHYSFLGLKLVLISNE